MPGLWFRQQEASPQPWGRMSGFRCPRRECPSEAELENPPRASPAPDGQGFAWLLDARPPLLGPHAAPSLSVWVCVCVFKLPLCTRPGLHAVRDPP